MRPDLPALLADLRAEQADLRGLVERTDLELATPAQGWDVRDAVAHLAGTDVEATRAARDPAGFVAALPQDVGALLAGQLLERRGLSRPELLASWQDGFAAMTQALAALDPTAPVPWYGPPMSPASFVTARLMEYWAHGQDVADAAGVRREPTGRLRHVCHLGVRTRGFSYAVRGLSVPPGDVRVEVAAPGGGTWSWGTGPDLVTGDALDLCLVVTQRRDRDDTGLVATGPLAAEWLAIAQCFAGPPGPGRGRA